MDLRKLLAVGLVGGSVLAMPPASRAQVEADGGNRQAEIRKLIADLSSPEESTRTAAMQKLVTMGADAQQALQEHIRSRDAAQIALQQIETNKVAGPTLISFEVTDMPVGEAIAKLAEVSGFKILPYHDNAFERANLPTITVSAKDVPFWEVMREIMAKGEVTVYESGNNDGSLRIIPQRNAGRSVTNAPVSLNGAFMVVATSIQRNHSVNLSDPENVSRSMNMQLQAFAEPKVNILRYHYQPEIEEAVDDKGNSLAQRDSSSGYSSGRSTSWQMSVPLVYPKEPGTKIVRLKGKMKMTVQTRSETLEVTDLDNVKDKTETIAGRRITVVSAKRTNDNQYQVKLIAYRDGMDQQEFYNMMNNRQAMQLLDAEGRAWRYSGGGSSSSGDRYEVEAQFYNNQGNNNEKPGDPVKLTWEIPTGSQEITIPFEFNDLPLP